MYTCSLGVEIVQPKMNIRSFSDLNDILIQPDDIGEENKLTETTKDTEDDEYDDEFHSENEDDEDVEGAFKTHVDVSLKNQAPRSNYTEYADEMNRA